MTNDIEIKFCMIWGGKKAKKHQTTTIKGEGKVIT